MVAPAALLDACARFASEVSPEATARVVELLATGSVHRAGSALTGDAARRFEELLNAWENCLNRPPSGELAHLICGAAHAVAFERRRQTVELVWSGPTSLSSTLRSTGPALLELIGSANTSLSLVTFTAYKVPEIAQALAAASQRGVDVRIITESDVASGGKVEFDPIPHLAPELFDQIEVYGWPVAERPRDAAGRHGSLHAKFAVSDRSRLLVSSANFTDYAFNLNVELGVLITGGPAPVQAAAHIDQMIRLGKLRRV